MIWDISCRPRSKPGPTNPKSGSNLSLRAELYVTAAFKAFSSFYFNVKHQMPVKPMDRHKGESLQLKSLLPGVHDLVRETRTERPTFITTIRHWVRRTVHTDEKARNIAREQLPWPIMAVRQGLSWSQGWCRATQSQLKEEYQEVRESPYSMMEQPRSSYGMFLYC